MQLLNNLLCIDQNCIAQSCVVQRLLARDCLKGQRDENHAANSAGARRRRSVAGAGTDAERHRPRVDARAAAGGRGGRAAARRRRAQGAERDGAPEPEPDVLLARAAHPRAVQAGGARPRAALCRRGGVLRRVLGARRVGQRQAARRDPRAAGLLREERPGAVDARRPLREALLRQAAGAPGGPRADPDGRRQGGRETGTLRRRHSR
mmetsp:Transcript_3387/g.7714  ORF Transcript_3387/g.7714 Transcript_3387/m.7714 type:complete len:207 (+) Transcript_3387:45-665(+)